MTPLFELAINVPAWLAQDADTPYPQRLRRDRVAVAGGSTAATAGRAAVAQIERWWQARAGADQDNNLPGLRLLYLRRLTGYVLLAIGILTGSTTALVLLRYDGSEPVNLAQVLGVLVVLQLLLALVTVCLLPLRIAGLRQLQNVLADLTPGGLAAAIVRRWSGSGAAGNAFGWHQARSAAAARFARWQALVWSQLAGLAFNLSALVVAAALVTFTDLAFAWSTTLQVDVDSVHAITAALAAPFAWLVPAAVPDVALIQATQFNRLDGVAALPAAVSGHWWAFVLLCMFAWGVLPRVLLLALAQYRLHVATANLLLQDPRVTALLDRMSTPLVDQSPDGIEPGISARPERAPAPPAADTAASTGTRGARAAVVIWSAATRAGDVDAQLRPLGLRAGNIHRAGGDASIEQDQHTIEIISAAAPARVVIVCRSWEPPLLEMLDFAADLRAACSTTSVTFVPLAAADADLNPAHVDTWRRAVGGLADPAIYVETGQ